MDTRKIIHIDMDAFYASVEQRDQPELKGKAVAVGGGGKRGVVSAASYEARKYGVRSAMPGMTAARLCPQLIFVKPRFDVYKEVSNQIREIFFEYTDLVEPLSLDEAFLDVTENKKGYKSAMKVAIEIRQRILETTKLTASAGVSFNKFLAKIASDINKPNGMKVIMPEEALIFLEELPIEKFFGVGKVTAKKMHNMGIYNGKDLKEVTLLELVKRFGKAGKYYYNTVRADDNRPVNPNRIRKSISAERTFITDLKTLEEMEAKLKPIVERVFLYMQKTSNFGRTITLKIKSPDFKIITRSRTLNEEVRHLHTIVTIIGELLRENKDNITSSRLLGISISNLTKEQNVEGIQLKLNFLEEE